jgi:hypothetical protein
LCLLLISRGCDINIRDDFGNNASYWAKKNKHVELLNFLPSPLTVTPTENNEYRDLVMEHRFLITADDKKKMQKGSNKR